MQGPQADHHGSFSRKETARIGSSDIYHTPLLPRLRPATKGIDAGQSQRAAVSPFIRIKGSSMFTHRTRRVSSLWICGSLKLTAHSQWYRRRWLASIAVPLPFVMTSPPLPTTLARRITRRRHGPAAGRTPCHTGPFSP
jgi:hypothetical protein